MGNLMNRDEQMYFEAIVCDFLAALVNCRLIGNWEFTVSGIMKPAPIEVKAYVEGDEEEDFFRQWLGREARKYTS